MGWRWPRVGLAQGGHGGPLYWAGPRAAASAAPALLGWVSVATSQDWVTGLGHPLYWAGSRLPLYWAGSRRRPRS